MCVYVSVCARARQNFNCMSTEQICKKWKLDLLLIINNKTLWF